MSDESQVLKPVTAPVGNGANWLIDGFDYFKKDWLAWIGVTIIYVILSIAAAFIPVLGNLVLYLFTPVLTGGIMLGCKAQEDGQEFNVGYLFKGFSQNFGQLTLIGVMYIAFSLLILILVAILAFAMFGDAELISKLESGDMNVIMENAMNFLLVVLIGLALYIPVLMALWFAPALIVLENQQAFAAMKLSFMGCLLNVIPLLVYGIVGFVLSIIASIPLMLGWLILAPMFVASIYLAYKDIYTSSDGA